MVVVVLVVSACQAPSQSPPAGNGSGAFPARAAPVEAARSPGGTPHAAASSAPAARASAAASPPAPTPPPQAAPVPLGTPARVGGFTMLVHGQRWIDNAAFELSSFAVPSRRLVIDISLRNDTDQALRVDRATFTVLGPSGDALNNEASVLGRMSTDMLPDALRTATCDADAKRALHTMPTVIALLPGEAVRTWTSFAPTPGLDQAQLHLAVELPVVASEQRTERGVFVLGAEAHPTSLAWTGHDTDPAREVTYEAMVLQNARIGSSEPVVDPYVPTRACLEARTVRVHATNTGAESLTLRADDIVLEDAKGWRYMPLTVDGSVLGPRAEQEIVITFATLQGVRDQPVALLLALHPRAAGSTASNGTFETYLRLALHHAP